jgi:hypothetical protein
MRDLDDPRESADLLRAIGRVAMASAHTDRALTELLNRLAGPNDTSWILFEGQSSDWLINSIVEVVKFDSSIATQAARSAIQDIVRDLRLLYQLRNTIIHGVWDTYPQFSELEDVDPDWRPRPRPWGGWDDDGRVYYCHRTRLRKVPPDQTLTVSDINRTADEFEAVAVRISRLRA